METLDEKLARLVADAEKTWASGVKPVRGKYRQVISGQKCACLIGASVLGDDFDAIGVCGTAQNKYDITIFVTAALINGFDGKYGCYVGDSEKAYLIGKKVGEKHLGELTC